MWKRGTRDGGRGTGARRWIPGPLPYSSVATFSEFHLCWTRQVHLSWTNDVHLSWTTMSIYPGQRCPSVLDNDVHLSWTTMSIYPGRTMSMTAEFQENPATETRQAPPPL